MDERAFIAKFKRSGQKRPHPGAYPAPTYETTWARFGRVLGAVGGTFVGPVGVAELPAAITDAIARVPGRCVASASAELLLSGADGWSRAVDAAANPHGLDNVELGIITAEAAVAENAALLLTATSLPERALAFLSQHVLVLVRTDVLVPDFITAQAILRTPLPHHVTWMSGPSKTADIEQTLVVGAHGARSLVVIAYEA